MKVLTFGRTLRLAMLGGAIYYVRKQGGIRPAWENLVEKLKPLADQAREKIADVAKTTKGTEASHVVQPPGGSGMPDFGDDKLH